MSAEHPAAQGQDIRPLEELPLYEKKDDQAAANSDSMDDRLDRALEDVEAGRVETFDNDEDFMASLDESPAATARARSEDLETNCPFCGQEAEEWQAKMLHEAHEQIELLALADLDSDEFDRHLQELRRFVGVA